MFVNQITHDLIINVIKVPHIRRCKLCKKNKRITCFHKARGMTQSTPFYVSPKGGSITCLLGDSGRISRSCLASRCIYTSDLHSAKLYLDTLESPNRSTRKHSACSEQRKTTLKWNSDGELSSVDMTRVLDRLDDPALTQCDFSCEYSSPRKTNKSPCIYLPTTSWLP